MTVGTSWLNKIGVLVFVIGLALLVGYSFAHIGPAGRVAIGFALSAAMLGTGVWLERRADFRNYAYGLVAGGWAGIYFTTFAMHEVPAARVIETDALALALLTTVASGMIWHSLRYRSQVVTSLAFVVGYATLALSPLSGFSLAASVPLSVALLVVSQRFGWSGVSVLGIGATYGTFVLRGTVFPGGAMDPASPVPYLTLAAYWLTFEAADIIGQRLRTRDAAGAASEAPAGMLALNAVGFLGAMLMTIPPSDLALLSTTFFATGAAYVVSAALRAWLLPGWRGRSTIVDTFDSTHGAVLAAAGLFAVAIGTRFHGTPESLARLLEAQLLITAGLTLGDAWLRRMGAVAFAVAAAHAWIHATGMSIVGDASNPAWAAATMTLILVAAAGYGSREAVHRRGVRPVTFEPVLTWIATGLVATAAMRELDPAYASLAGLLLAALLLEGGFRRMAEYVHQAYVTGALAAYGVAAAFVARVDESGGIGGGRAPSGADEWIVLPAAIALTAFAAWRLSTRGRAAATPGWEIAGGTAATLAALFVAIFEWRVLPAEAIAPAWSMTAMGLVALGAWRGHAVWRWQGYVLAVAPLVRAVMPLATRIPDGAAEMTAVAAVIAGTYGAAYFGSRATRRKAAPTRPGSDSVEGAVIGALSIIATASLMLFKWRVLPEVMVAPAWAVTGTVLVALGVSRRKPGQRWQGYAVTLFAGAQIAQSLLAQPTVTAETSVWTGVFILAAYLTAWLAHRPAARAADPAAAAMVMSTVGTLVLALIESRWFVDPGVGPVWAATGLALLASGLWSRATELRWQAYALVAAGALRAGRPVFQVEETTWPAIFWLFAVILAVYGCGLIARRLSAASPRASLSAQTEDALATGFSVGATALLAWLILDEARPSMVTLVLGLQGLALMGVGLAARERIMRLSGLALLLTCILKLFVYDLRELDPVARILSFVILGLFLLGTSWTYTKYRQQIQKLL